MKVIKKNILMKQKEIKFTPWKQLYGSNMS